MYLMQNITDFLNRAFILEIKFKEALKIIYSLMLLLLIFILLL